MIKPEDLQEQVQTELRKLWKGRRGYLTILALVVLGYGLIRVVVAIAFAVVNVLNAIANSSNDWRWNIIALALFAYAIWRMSQKDTTKDH